MRITGLLILFVSFLFIAFDALVGFPARQHTLWMWQTQHLPPSELVPREKASAAIRASCLALSDAHRNILFPATTMLAGALLFGFSPRRSP